MSKTYIVLTIVAVLVAVGLLFLPEKGNYKETKPELLIKEINDPARFFHVDQIAERLIDEDPSMMLIDVRTADQFAGFSLPGAINIPLDQVLLPEWKDYLYQNDLDVVLFSNSDLYADQAWILCTRLGYKNLYVLKGGLNEWYTCILNPIEPPETAPTEEFDLFSFRSAASLYFKGGADVNADSGDSRETIIIKKREKKSTTAGGC
ncbi:MAG: rhodanese-like domain-containing protein [Bacteroidales bacterium]